MWNQSRFIYGTRRFFGGENPWATVFGVSCVCILGLSVANVLEVVFFSWVVRKMLTYMQLLCCVKLFAMYIVFTQLLKTSLLVYVSGSSLLNSDMGCAQVFVILTTLCIIQKHVKVPKD